MYRRELHPINEGYSIREFFFFNKQNKFFFNKCKLCIGWNWFIAKIILTLQKYLFWGYSKWWQIKFEQRSVIKLLASKKYKPYKIYKRMYDVYRKVYFSQKNIYNQAKHGFASTSLNEKKKKSVHGVEIHWLSGKGKIPGVAVSKEGHADRVEVWKDVSYWCPLKRCNCK